MRTKIDPSLYLAPHQYALFGDPHLVVRFAHLLEAKHFPDHTIYADVHASLNSRPMQPLIPVDVELTAQPITIGHYGWIVDLRE